MLLTWLAEMQTMVTVWPGVESGNLDRKAASLVTLQVLSLTSCSTTQIGSMAVSLSCFVKNSFLSIRLFVFLPASSS